MDHPRQRILLIDDEPSVLSALELLLDVLGYEVVGYPSGTAAIAQITDNCADCIICDLKMPQMSGIDVVRAVRAKGITLPFVLMSAHATEKDQELAKSAGVNAFLAKPFTPEDLQRALATVGTPGSARP